MWFNGFYYLRVRFYKEVSSGKITKLDKDIIEETSKISCKHFRHVIPDQDHYPPRSR